MRSNRWGLALGLFNPVAFVHALNEVDTVTVRVPTGTCVPGAYTGSFNNGEPGSGSGGPPKLVSAIDSSYGSYSLQGCFDASAAGFVITEASTGSSITLEGCAAFCKGSPYLAVVNGNTCNCLSSGPSGLGVDIGEYGCMATCTGNSSQCCGSTRYGNVYHCPTCSPGSGGSTTITYTTTDSKGSIITATTTSALPSVSGGSTTITYTTTDSLGSTITATTTSALPATTVILETTTDSKGSTYTTSTTSTLPVSSPSTSVVVVTSTDSQGSTFTSSFTSTVPPAPTTSVIIITSSETVVTTDSKGSTVTSISTVVTSSTTTATSVSTPATNPDLPTNGEDCKSGKVTDGNGQQYEIYCGVDFPGNDLITPHYETFAECLIACDQYVPNRDVANNAACVAISFGYGNVGGNCYLKSAITTVNVGNGGFDSARMLSYIPKAYPQIVSLDAPTNGGPATSGPANPVTQLGGQASTPVVGPTTPVVNPGPVATDPTTPVGPVGPIDTAAITFPCPAYDMSAYIDPNGEAYQIECSANYPGKDLTAVHIETFKECILACDAYVPSPNVGGGLPCIGVSWGEGNPGGNCYLKSAITAGSTVYGTGFDSAYKVSYPKPGQTITPTTPAMIPSTPAVSSPASSGPAASPPAASSPAASSPAASPPAASSPAAAPPVASSPTASPPAASPPAASPVSSGPAAVQTITTPPACPLNNNTRYTNIFGTTFDVTCGRNLVGRNGKPLHADTVDECLQFCDILLGCAGVTFASPPPPADQANCYPYSQVTSLGGEAPSGVFAGIPVNGPTTSQVGQSILCPNSNGQTYTDVFAGTYTIGCGSNLAGTDLYATQTNTLLGCLTYCTTYDTCKGVAFVGTEGGALPPDQTPNCFPKSTIGATTAQPGAFYAIRAI